MKDKIKIILIGIGLLIVVIGIFTFFRKEDDGIIMTHTSDKVIEKRVNISGLDVLEINNIKIVRKSDGSYIQGVLVNTSDDLVEVGIIKITLKDSDDNALVNFTLDIDKIVGKEKIPFEAATVDDLYGVVDFDGSKYEIEKVE